MPSGGGSSGSSGGTTVSKTEPWDAAKPYYEQLYKDASNAYGQIDKSGYTGPMVAPQSDQTTQALNYTQSLAPVVQQQVQPAVDMAQATARGDYLDPSSNPYLQSTIAASIQPTLQAFRETVVPGINSAAIQSGAYGGARNGLALGRASQGLVQEISNTAAKTAYQNYATERGYQNSSPQTLQQAISLETLPAQLLSQVGSAQQQSQQDIINAEIDRRNANLMAPYRGIGEFTSALGAGQGTSTTTNVSGQKANPVSGAIGGALGLGGLGYAGAAALGATNPLGWALGLGALGGLAGGLF